MISRFAFVTLAILMIVTLRPARPAAAQAASGGDSETRRLIAQLGDAAFDKRVEATERLISVGPRATDLLREAAAGDDLEIAIRARHLLAVLDQLLFAGVAVELRVSPNTVAWNDEVTLEVEVQNESDFDARVPFEATGPSDGPAHDRARQVGAMLDLADYLVVTGPDDRPAQLHVDDIAEDPRMVDAVQRRIDDPPVDVISPHTTRRYRFDGFNRGWARYRLLTSGPHRLQLVYQPQWDDEEMRHAGVGRVVSNVATVTVSEPAPECVRQLGAPADMRISRAGGDLVATLVNQTDVPVWVNRNLSGSASAPYAQLQWSIECDRQSELLPPPGESPDDAFSVERIDRVAPAQSIVLGRIPIAAVGEANLIQQSDDARACVVVGAYTNLTSHAWQIANAETLARNPNTPKALQKPLPDRMLVTTLHARIAYSSQE